MLRVGKENEQNEGSLAARATRPDNSSIARLVRSSILHADGNLIRGHCLAQAYSFHRCFLFGFFLFDGASVPVRLKYDKALWSGLSWAAAEVDHKDLRAGVPLIIRCSSLENQLVELKVEVYSVVE